MDSEFPLGPSWWGRGLSFFVKRNKYDNEKISVKGNIYEIVGVQGHIHLTAERSFLFFAHPCQRLTVTYFPSANEWQFGYYLGWNSGIH